MPKFQYRAKSGPSKIIDGVLDAENLDRAIKKVIQLGYVPIDVEHLSTQEAVDTIESVKTSFSFGRRIPSADIAAFTRQMSDLIDASVPILRALQIAVKQTQNAQLKEVVKDIYAYVNDGASFSEALAQHKNVFSSLYVNMVKTGEVGGQLELILNRLADYLEKEQETLGKVRSSLAYPTFILLFGIVTIFILLTFVVPKLTVMFDDFDQELPLPTLILTNTSATLAQFWWVVVIVIIGLGFYLRTFLSSEYGRRWFHRFILRMPKIGEFIKIVEISRFTRTLGTLLESGVPITVALNAVWATLQNEVLREEIKDVSEQVANGVSLNVALSHCNFFPEAAIDMIAVGEETGKLEKGLYKIATTFDRQADQTMRTIISLLGPIVLVIIFSVVACVVIAMLLPILQMNLLIQ